MNGNNYFLLLPPKPRYIYCSIESGPKTIGHVFFMNQASGMILNPLKGFLRQRRVQVLKSIKIETLKSGEKPENAAAVKIMIHYSGFYTKHKGM